MSCALTGKCESCSETAELPGAPGPWPPPAPICPKFVSAVKIRYISASLGSIQPGPGPGPADDPACDAEPPELPEERCAELPLFSAFDEAPPDVLPDAPPLAGPPVEPIAEP